MKEEAERCIEYMQKQYDIEIAKGTSLDIDVLNALHADIVHMTKAVNAYQRWMVVVAEDHANELVYNSDVPHGATHYSDDLDGIAFYRVSDMVMYHNPLKSQTQWQLVHHPLDIDKWLKCLKPISEYKSTNIQGL